VIELLKSDPVDDFTGIGAKKASEKPKKGKASSEWNQEQE
jgi:hypothetical protein